MTEELLARLAELEAERDILKNLYRYAHTIDVGDEVGWADCFTEDGAFETTPRFEGYEPYRIVGRERLQEFISHHTRPPGMWHKHMLVEPLIEVNGVQATSRAYFFLLIDHEGRPMVRVFGRYVDQLRREADGRWRFVERHAYLESLVPGLPPLAYGRELADQRLAVA
jgi:ketosteroid isomerase-like protein